jgi:hypothetical protein
MHKTEQELRELFPAHLSDAFVEWHPVGSRYICDPAPMDTDVDFICLTENAMRSEAMLIGAGWQENGSRLPDNINQNFISYKKGEVNLVVTPSHKFYSAFLEASNFCRKLNVMEKSDRQRIHVLFFFEAGLY